MTEDRVTLSVVATLYRSAPFVAEFCSRAAATARGITSRFEILLVNDGSSDNSVELASQLRLEYPEIRIINLARNFGHHAAITAGIDNSRGDFVFLIDSDLEESPEWLSDFWSILREKPDIDVVYGVQENRKGAWLEQASGHLFYKIFNFLSSTSLPQNLVTARLMRRRYVDALIRYTEVELFLGGIWAHCGFSQLAVTVRKGSRPDSTYTLSKRAALLVNAITSFSSKPLAFIGAAGIIVSALALVFLVYLLAQRILFDTPLAGWTSIMASVWFLGGIILVSLGIIGLYIAKIYKEVKGRPRYIIKEILP